MAPHSHSARSVGIPLSRLRAYFFPALPGWLVNGAPVARQGLVRRWIGAARARLRVAEQLDPEYEFAAAIALYREGLVALVGASLAATEESVPEADVADAGRAFLALERTWPILQPRIDLGEFQAARRVLCEPPRLNEAPPGKDEASAACACIARLAVLLERAIDPRRRGETIRRRAVGSAVFALALLLGAATLSARMRMIRSIARNHPVTLSSVYPGTHARPGALVNGILEYSYGAHTDVQDDPWILLDLERPRRIGKIAVHNRGDGYFSECLPLILEVGTDGSSFKQLAVRETVFSRTDPWVLDRLDETVRYIRLRKTGRTYIALTELAAYSR